MKKLAIPGFTSPTAVKKFGGSFTFPSASGNMQGEPEMGEPEKGEKIFDFLGVALRDSVLSASPKKNKA